MGMQGATMDATSWITGAIVLCGGFIGLSPIRTNDFYLVLPNSLLRPQCGPTQIVAFGGVSFRLASSSSAVGSLPCFLVRWWGFALELEDAFELESAKRFSCNLNNRILARQILRKYMDLLQQQQQHHHLLIYPRRLSPRATAMALLALA